MALRFYNTLTRKKEIFRPLKNKQAGLYACGPTVYWYAHVGNMRSYLFVDVLTRVLEYNDYKVKYVMNFTDVGHLTSGEDTGEDKMEKGAKREGKTAKEIADFYIAAFKKDAATLNIKPPTVYARATEHIREQIELVKILEKKGFSYEIADGVYFDTSKLKDYGQLARLDLAGLKAGARVEQVAGKKNPTDFALWKLTPKNVKRQQEWRSPWGKGFPGWHLECSAMSQKYLGRQFDIHCGGIDLIPVHHTNEIAQSEAAHGKIPACFWLHGEHLLIDGEKMAKSVGNILTVEKISEIFNPLAFRYLVLTAHYHSLLNLTWESLEAAQHALGRLYRLMLETKNAPAGEWRLKKLGSKLGLAGKKTAALLQRTKKYEEDFLTSINDDLNMPKALSIVWLMVEDKEIPLAAKRELLLKFDRVLGLDLDKTKPAEPPAQIKKMAQDREQYRQQKKWQKADVLRNQIEKQGWVVEDTIQGPKLKPKI
jgi:cysteinyl-tRNA synthetase